MKKKTMQEQIDEYRAEIIKELERWKYINKNGCNDPFWGDGLNMNLVRNHIIYYKNEIAQICEENGLVLPEEFYMPLPPEVNNYYMAKLDREKRVQRLTQEGNRPTTKKVKYDETQLS